MAANRPRAATNVKRPEYEDGAGDKKKGENVGFFLQPKYDPPPLGGMPPGPPPEGYLMKLSGKGMMGEQWQKRYFQLRGPFLMYWQNQADTKRTGGTLKFPKGVTDLRKIGDIDGPKSRDDDDTLILNNRRDNSVSKRLKAQVTKPPTPGSQAVAMMQPWKQALEEAKLWDEFKISVKVVTGGDRTITLDVEPTDTIKAVKKKIEDLQGIDYAQLKLYFGQEELDDDEKTLASYKIKKNSTLRQIEPEKPPPPRESGHLQASQLARQVADYLVDDTSALGKFKTAFNTRREKPADDEDWLPTQAAKDKLKKIWAQYCTKKHYDPETKSMKVLDEMDMKYIYADKFKEKVMTLWRNEDVDELVKMLEEPFTEAIGQKKDENGHVIERIPNDPWNTWDLEKFEKIGVLKPEQAAEEVAKVLLQRCKDLKIAVPNGKAMTLFKERKANIWREYEGDDHLADKNMIRDEMKKLVNVIEHEFTTHPLLEGAVMFINAMTMDDKLPDQLYARDGLDRGRTALCKACGKGEIDKVRLIIKNGGSERLHEGGYSTAIFSSMGKAHGKDVIIGDPTEKDHQMWPLFEALNFDENSKVNGKKIKEDIVQALLRKDGGILDPQAKGEINGLGNCSLLMAAACNTKVAMQLIAIDNSKEHIAMEDDTGATILHKCASEDNDELIRAIMELDTVGNDINFVRKKDEMDSTALLMASFWGKQKAALELVECDPTIEHITMEQYGKTAYSEATGELKEAMDEIMNQKPILVIGASGQVGKATLLALSGKGVKATAGLRDPSPQNRHNRELVGTKDIIALAHADMSKPETLDTAIVEGATVLIVTPGAEDREKLTCDAINKAAENKAGHIVVISLPVVVEEAGTPDVVSTMFGKQFKPIEAAVKACKTPEGNPVPYTIVRLPMFMDNILSQVDSIKYHDSMYTPVGLDKRFSTISVKDAGLALANIVNRPKKWADKTITLGGVETSYKETVEAYSNVLGNEDGPKPGRQIKCHSIEPAAAKESMMEQGWPEWQVDGVLELLDLINTQGSPKASSLIPEKDDSTRKILRRRPEDPTMFMKRLKSLFSKEDIVVFGSSGHVGKATVRALSDIGVPVTAGVRNDDDRDPKNQQLVEKKGVTLKKADMSKPSTLGPIIVEGAKVFIATPGAENRTTLTCDAIKEAAKAKAGHIVVISLPVVIAEKSTIFGDQFKPIEEAIKTCGVPYTIVRLPMFMENVLSQPIKKDEKDPGTGAVYMPVKANQPYSAISVKDVGIGIAKILTQSEKYKNSTITLAGVRTTYMDTVAAYKKVLNLNTLKYVENKPHEAKEIMMKQGWPEWQADGVLELLELVNEGSDSGLIPEKDDDTFAVLGREAMSPSDFMTRFKSMFKPKMNKQPSAPRTLQKSGYMKKNPHSALNTGMKRRFFVLGKKAGSDKYICTYYQSDRDGVGKDKKDEIIVQGAEIGTLVGSRFKLKETQGRKKQYEFECEDPKEAAEWCRILEQASAR